MSVMSMMLYFTFVQMFLRCFKNEIQQNIYLFFLQYYSKKAKKKKNYYCNMFQFNVKNY